MLTADGPKVIEFNVRLGDPEAQVILPLIDEPLLPLLRRRGDGALRRPSCRLGDGPRSSASSSPRAAIRSRRNRGSRSPASTRPRRFRASSVFHAGTALRDGQLVTAGGRVLTVVGRGARFRRRDRARLRRRRSTIHVRRHAVPARHRTKGAASDSRREVLRRHVRLPREPGRLARLRGGAARRAARSPAAPRAGRPGRRQHLLGDGQRRSGRAPDDPPHRARQPAARIVVTGCYATRRPDEVAALPNVVRVVRNDDKPRLLVVRSSRTEFRCLDDAPTRVRRRRRQRAARRSSRVSPAARRSRCACRPAAREPCSYCIIPTTRGAPRSVPLDGDARARSSGSRRPASRRSR